MSKKPRTLSSLLGFTLVMALGLTLASGPNSFGVGRAYASNTVDETGVPNGVDGRDGGEKKLTNAATGSDDYLSLGQTAKGGAGGQGNTGVLSGQGGFASSILSTQLEYWSVGNLSTIYEVWAYGGYGGSGYPYSSANGARGGDAEVGMYFKGSGDFKGNANATGGPGGDTLGDGSVGGNGGQATFQGKIYGESTTGGTVDIIAAAQNGYGGAAGGGYIPSSASGGSGAKIILNNAVDGETTGSLSLSQRAGAGSGGGAHYSSGSGGQAGSAESVLSYSKTANYLHLDTYAAGGSGGSALNEYYEHGGNGADGQSGKASTDATNTGTAVASATVGGGKGGDSTWGTAGQAGAATSTARAVSTASYAQSGANATGGDGGTAGSSTGQAGGAAEATAESITAFPQYGGNTYYGGSAYSNARGGAGGHGLISGGAGGAATATSTYIYEGNQSATGGSVDAYASGGNGGQGGKPGGNASPGGAGGNATAAATGNAPGAGLTVNSSAQGGAGGYSYSGDHGQGGEALATSTGTATSGFVSSAAVSQKRWDGSTLSDNFHSVVALDGADIVNGTSVSVAGANTGPINRSLVDAQGKQAAAFGTVLPIQTSVAPLLASNHHVQAAFSQDSTVLGYGVLGQTSTGSNVSGYNSSLLYTYTIADISNPQHLLVGLLDSNFSGDDNGFKLDFKINGGGVNPLFSQTFDTPGEALGFFNDNVLDLGFLTQIPDSYGRLNLTFTYSLMAAPGTSFNFNFIEGSASPVPVPASVLLLGSGLLGLGAWRRFRKG